MTKKDAFYTVLGIWLMGITWLNYELHRGDMAVFCGLGTLFYFFILYKVIRGRSIQG